ncbi:MAG: HAMP domain-containing histidine kinase [Acidobacteriaceae bacterium]|nr:HAMP domain-containing histidine kinase [Acidobacteriaceae bacterium]
MSYAPNPAVTPSVAIISDDPEFARMVMDRWQSERQVPSFTLLGSDFSEGGCSPGWDLAVVGLIREDGLLLRVVEALHRCAAVLYVSDSAAVTQLVRAEYPRTIAFQRTEDAWVEVTVTLCCEVLRRVQAMARLIEMERTMAQNEQYALLGRYMLEMRHNVNNALTSVLGNAELLLLEPGAFSAQFRDQIHTIHIMALRMHEIMQRFTSIETEMRFADTWPRREPARATSPALLMKSSA